MIAQLLALINHAMHDGTEERNVDQLTPGGVVKEIYVYMIHQLLSAALLAELQYYPDKHSQFTFVT